MLGRYHIIYHLSYAIESKLGTIYFVLFCESYEWLHLSLRSHKKQNKKTLFPLQLYWQSYRSSLQIISWDL